MFSFATADLWSKMESARLMRAHRSLANGTGAFTPRYPFEDFPQRSAVVFAATNSRKVVYREL